MGTPIIDIVKEDNFIMFLNNTHHVKDLPFYGVCLALHLFINRSIDLPDTTLNAVRVSMHLILSHHDLGTFVVHIFRL